jgi:hypothetical protein
MVARFFCSHRKENYTKGYFYQRGWWPLRSKMRCCTECAHRLRAEGWRISGNFQATAIPILSSTEQAVSGKMRRIREPLTLREVAHGLGYYGREVDRALASLCARGIVRRIRGRAEGLPDTYVLK